MFLQCFIDLCNIRDDLVILRLIGVLHKGNIIRFTVVQTAIACALVSNLYDMLKLLR